MSVYWQTLVRNENTNTCFYTKTKTEVKKKPQMTAQSPPPPKKKKKWESWCLKGEREDSPEEENERKAEKKEKWWQVIFHLSLSWQQMLFPILLGHAADPI